MWNEAAPELSRFSGSLSVCLLNPDRLITRLTSTLTIFHAYYQGDVGIFSFNPVELIGGSLPRRQTRLVEAWADRLQEGRSPAPIEPLNRPLMNHSAYRVKSFDIVAPYTLCVRFDDDTMQTVDFQPVLAGELYGPLRDLELFNQVMIDPEAETLVWPNGADFDPATLHDWDTNAQAFLELARRWEPVQA